MLQFEAHQVLCRERVQERMREAETERLLHQARGARLRRRRRLALAAGVGRLLHPGGKAAGAGA